MLLTLLPLAGWAQSAEFGEIGLGKFTYGDTSFPIPVVKDKEGAILADTYYDVDATVAYADEACTQAIHKATVSELAAMKADGTTKYWIKVTGKPATAYAGQVGKAWFMVDKADLTITYTASLNRTYGDDPVALDETKFSAAGMKYSQAWDDIKKGSAPTGYSTADNNAGVNKVVTFDGGWTADNYNITYDVKLTIAPLNISTTAEITKEQGDIVYTGTDFVGTYTVKLGDETLTQGNRVVYYENVAEYNAAKGTSLTGDEFDALSDAEKTKVAATGDYYVASVHDASTTAYKPGITFQGNYSGVINPTVGFKIAKAPITVSLKKDIHRTYTGGNYKNTEVKDAVAQVTFADVAAYNAAKGRALRAEQYAALPAAEKIKTPAIPAAEFNYSGIVGDDVAMAATIKAEFTAPTSVKTANTADIIVVNNDGYPLTITGGAAGDGTYGKNYEFKTYLPGKLIIDPVELYIKAANKEKTVGENDPANVAVGCGLVDGETIGGVTFDRESGEGVGVYEITPNIDNITVKKGNSDRKNCYIISVAEAKGKLTIKQAAIVVTILEAEKNYGEGDPQFDYAVSGCAKEVVGTVTINREPGEAAGFYALTAEVANPDPAKYESLTVVPGILTINKAPLTFTMPAKNVVTDDEVDALTKDGILVEGINNDDDPATLYTLAFNVGAGALTEDADIDEGVIQDVDKSYGNGYMAVLTDAAKANYMIIGTNAIDEVAPATPFKATGKLIINDGEGTALALTCEETDYEKIIARDGETVNVTINFTKRNDRTFGTTAYGSWKAEYWASMVLPFDITVRELSEKMGYAIVNVIDKDGYKTDGEGNPVFKFKLTMKGGNGSTEVLKANRPFVIKLADDVVTTDIDFGTKKIIAPTAADVLEAGGGATFEGTYLTKTVTPSNNDCWFLLGDYEKGWAFIKGSANSSVWNWDIISTEGFIKTTVAAREATFIMEELDGSTTALKSISADATNDVKVKADGWYTINGVKLNTVPTQKGIYINNGKKVVVK